MKLIPILNKIWLFLASTFLCIFILEIFFPKVLNKIPLKLHGNIDPGLFVLVQSSKSSVIPKNYIALAGDSNAVGLGDWLNELKKNSRLENPSYHSAHFIHQKTGQDVISFGAGGAGSLRGLVSEPINQFLHINSKRAFSLEQPKHILVYFYAGNDLNNNIEEVEQRFKSKYDTNQIYNPKYFRRFIEEVILKNHALTTSDSIWSNFIFSKFTVKGIINLFNQQTSKEGKQWDKNFQALKNSNSRLQWNWALIEEYPDFLLKTFDNIALIDGKETILSHRVQAPPIDLSPDQIKLGLYVFEQSLIYLSEFFDKSEITVIHIPSPLSAYQFLLPKGPSNLQTKLSQGGKYESRLEKIRNSSYEICKKIKTIAAKQGINFLDTTQAFRVVGKKQLIHGSVDFNHLNKSGYELLAETIIYSFVKRDSIKLGCHSF